MNGSMDVERRCLDLAMAFQHPAVAVDPKQIVRGQPEPMNAVRVDEEPLPIHGQAEVVVDRLVQIESRSETKRRSHGSAFDLACDIVDTGNCVLLHGFGASFSRPR
jgi:hypothetical protein